MTLSRVGEKIKNIFPTTPDKLPVYIFPGILGNKSDVSLLGKTLYKKSHFKRPIYCYNDPRLEDLDLDLTQITHTVDGQIKSIIAEIKSTLSDGPPGSFPLFFVGYSDGFRLATLVAQSLQQSGEDVYVYNIDGVPPQSAKDYLSYKSASCINDLIEITQHAAKISGLEYYLENKIIQKENLPHLSVKEIIEHIEKLILLDNVEAFNFEKISLNIEHFSKLSSGEAIKLLETIIDENSSSQNIEESEELLSLKMLETSLKDFRHIVMIEITNLYHLINYNPLEMGAMEPLRSITALITNSTDVKYGGLQTADGWQAHAKDVHYETKTELLNKKHTDLLKEDNINELTLLINQFLKSSVPKNEFLKKRNAYLDFDLNRYDQSNDDIENNFLIRSSRSLARSKSSQLMVNKSEKETSSSCSPLDTESSDHASDSDRSCSPMPTFLSNSKNFRLFPEVKEAHELSVNKNRSVGSEKPEHCTRNYRA